MGVAEVRCRWRKGRFWTEVTGLRWLAEFCGYPRELELAF